VWYRYGKIFPNSAFLVFEFGIQTLKLARQSGHGFSLRILSIRSGLFAWPISTVGADMDSRKQGSFFLKRSVVAIKSSKWCVELSESALLFGRGIDFFE
jgi:hypothetical protein